LQQCYSQGCTTTAQSFWLFQLIHNTTLFTSGLFFCSTQGFFFNLPLTRPASFMNHNATKLRGGVKKRERSGITALNRHLLGSLVKQLRAMGQIMSCSATVASPYEFKSYQQQSHSSATSPATLQTQPGMETCLLWGSSISGPTDSTRQSSAPGTVPSPSPDRPHFPDFLTLPVALMAWCTVQNTQTLRFMASRCHPTYWRGDNRLPAFVGVG